VGEEKAQGVRAVVFARGGWRVLSKEDVTDAAEMMHRNKQFLQQHTPSIVLVVPITKCILQTRTVMPTGERQFGGLASVMQRDFFMAGGRIASSLQTCITAGRLAAPRSIKRHADCCADSARALLSTVLVRC